MAKCSSWGLMRCLADLSLLKATNSVLMHYIPSFHSMYKYNKAANVYFLPYSLFLLLLHDTVLMLTTAKCLGSGQRGQSALGLTWGGTDSSAS